MFLFSCGARGLGLCVEGLELRFKVRAGDIECRPAGVVLKAEGCFRPGEVRARRRAVVATAIAIVDIMVIVIVLVVILVLVKAILRLVVIMVDYGDAFRSK